MEEQSENQPNAETVPEPPKPEIIKIEKLVIPDSVKDEYRLQENLNGITDENVTKIGAEIAEKFTTHDGLVTVAQNIQYYSQIRYTQIPLLVKLCEFLVASIDEFEPILLKWTFGVLLRRNFLAGIHTLENITEKVAECEDQYYFFMRELGPPRVAASPTADIFAKKKYMYNNYRQSNFNELDDMVEHGFQKGSPQYILRYDQVDQLGYYCDHPDFNPDQLIPNTMFCPAGAVKDRYVERKLSLLSFAAFFGSEKCLSFLISKGAKVNEDACVNAVRGGNMNVIEILRQNGGNFKNCAFPAATYHRKQIFDWVFQCHDWEAEPLDLYQAVSTTFVLSIIYTMQNGFEKPPEDKMPIQRAVITGQLPLVELLVENGLDVDGRNKRLDTPLFKAASMGRLEIARYLLEKSANVSLSNDKGWQPLHGAAKNGCVELGQLLLDHGADINAYTATGINALHIALFSRHRPFAHMLLERGVSVTAATHEAEQTPKTPLVIALKNDYDDIAEALLDRGASINAETPEMTAPLDVAIERKNKPLLNRLVKMGATSRIAVPIELLVPDPIAPIDLDASEYDVRKADRFGRTILFRACITGQLDVVKRLVKEGAAVEYTDFEKRTPLMAALLNGHEDVAVFLIENGANVGAKMKDGTAPLHIASRNNMLRAAQALIDHECYMNPASKSIRTPLVLATSQEMRDLLERNGGV